MTQANRNRPLDWSKVGTAELRLVHQLLESLEGLMVRERSAIAKFHSDEIAELSAEKTKIADSIRAVVVSAKTAEDQEVSQPHRRLRAAVSRLSMRIAASARANSALIRDATEAVHRALGLQGEAETYDRRARKIAPTESWARRRV